MKSPSARAREIESKLDAVRGSGVSVTAQYNLYFMFDIN